MGGNMSTNTPEEWPDIEGAMRQFLRDDPGLQALIGQRVFFSVPRKVTEAGSFPMIIVTRIGGGQGRGDAPQDNPMIQFDVYGRKADAEGGGKVAMQKVSRALRQALSRLRGETDVTHVVDGVTLATRLFDPRVSTIVYSPLPGDDRPRDIIMAIIPCIVADAEVFSFYGGGYG